MAYADLWNELRGYVPTISPLLAQKLINRAWRNCLDASDWSFLEGFAVLQVPKVVTAGTISWTQFGNTITGDATATAAWTPLLLGTPPFIASQNAAGQPLIGTGYQIKALNGPLYSIIGSDNGSPIMTLTVDRIISEPSNAGTNYQALRALYGAPSSDWISYINIINVQEGFPISGRRLSGSQAQLSMLDPQDESTGDPYAMFSQFADANGMPIKRLWPTPVNQVGLTAIFKRRGTDLSPTVDLPASFPVNCLLEKAKVYAAQFQATQKRIPGDETNWNMEWKTHQENWQRPVYGELAQAIKIDGALRTPPPIIRRGPAFYPWSGAFAASHDTTRMACFNSFFGGTF
jgi:hypothetical protein